MLEFLGRSELVPVDVADLWQAKRKSARSSMSSAHIWSSVMHEECTLCIVTERCRLKNVMLSDNNRQRCVRAGQPMMKFDSSSMKRSSWNPYNCKKNIYSFMLDTKLARSTDDNAS